MWHTDLLLHVTYHLLIHGTHVPLIHVTWWPPPPWDTWPPPSCDIWPPQLSWLALSQPLELTLKAASYLELDKHLLDVERRGSASLQPRAAVHPTHPTACVYSLKHTICPRKVTQYFCLIVRIIDLDRTQWWFKYMFIHEHFQRTLVLYLWWLG